MKNNYYLLGVISLVCVLLAYSGFEGKKQIEQRKKDYATYVNVMESISKKEDLDTIIKNIENLEANYGKSDKLTLAKIEAYAAWNESKNVQSEFENLFNENKHLTDNSTLLVLYSEALYTNGEKDKAKEAISKASQIGIPDEYKQRADVIMN